MVKFSNSPLEIITHDIGDSHSLYNNNVNAVLDNVNGDIWYATDRGVSISKAKSRDWMHVLKECVTVTLCPSSNGNVLLGTYGEGIYVFNKYGCLIKRFDKESGALTSNYIFSIKKD